MWAECSRAPARTCVLVLLTAFAFLLAACSTPTPTAGDGHPTTETQTVVFSATGSGTSAAHSITYATLRKGTPHGQNGIIKNVPLPWSKTIVETVSPDATTGLWPYYYLDVHNGPGALTSVTCSISVDGRVVSTGNAAGPNAIASCGAPSHASAPIHRS